MKRGEHRRKDRTIDAGMCCSFRVPRPLSRLEGSGFFRAVSAELSGVFNQNTHYPVWATTALFS